MFLIALRLLILLALAYLFGLIVAWIFSFFNNSDGGDDFRSDDSVAPKPPEPGKTSQQKRGLKRVVEVDESYYLEEFDLSQKNGKD